MPKFSGHALWDTYVKDDLHAAYVVPAGQPLTPGVLDENVVAGHLAGLWPADLVDRNDTEPVLVPVGKALQLFLNSLENAQ